MNDVAASELHAAEVGSDIVFTTVGGFTYVGWLLAARRQGSGVLVRVRDFARRIEITALLHPDHVVHTEPPAPLALGDAVQRSTDPTSLGVVVGISHDSMRRTVYRVQWSGEAEPRWHVRSKLQVHVVDASEVSA